MPGEREVARVGVWDTQHWGPSPFPCAQKVDGRSPGGLSDYLVRDRRPRAVRDVDAERCVSRGRRWCGLGEDAAVPPEDHVMPVSPKHLHQAAPDPVET